MHGIAPGSDDASTDERAAETLHTIDEDIKRLHNMGYAQELMRRMSGFSNFAISMSIICILAGCITSFQLAFCGAGPAGVGAGSARLRSASVRTTLWWVRFTSTWVNIRSSCGSWSCSP